MALWSGAAAAQAQTYSFDIPAEPLSTALREFARVSGQQIIFTEDLVASKSTTALHGNFSADDALERLLAGTKLVVERSPSGAIMVRSKNTQTPHDRAANTNSSDNSIETVVVTGTNIRGIVDGPSPVFVFDRDDIRKTGVGTVQDFFYKLPQNFGGGANGENTLGVTFTGRDDSSSHSAGSGINLRGLGSAATLTLVDGKRLAPSDAVSFTDVSMIPLSAIDHIDVMTDGASAIYGSDAVSGVVNIVLRNDFDGLETSGRYATVTQGGYQEYRLSQTGGVSWGSGHALLTYEYYHQDDLPASNKPFSKGAPFQPFDLIPSTEHNSLFGNVSQEVAQGITLTAEAYYSRRFTDLTLSSSDFAGGSLLSSGKPVVQEYGASLGATFDLPAGWQVRLDGGYGTNSDFVSTSQLLFGVLSNFTDHITNRATSMNVVSDGSIFSLPAGDVKLAVGASYRREGYSEINSSLPPLTTSREVVSGFAEAFVPLVGEANELALVKRLEVTAAFRYDNYSDFGSTVNPKFGLLWEPLSGVTLRSSYGTSFRAPFLNDLSTRTNQAILTDLPDPASPTGKTITLVARGGNPNLKPEAASTWTAGADWKPAFADGLMLRFNYYNIDYTGRVDRATNNIPAIFLQQAILSPITTRNPSASAVQAILISSPFFTISRVGPFAVPAGQDQANTQAIADLRFSNISAESEDGIDFGGEFETDTGYGQLGLSLNADYIFHLLKKLTATSPTADIAGTSYNPTRFKLRAGATFVHGDLTAGIFANYADVYVDNTNAPSRKVDSWATIDLSLSYALSDTLLISASAQNVFDSAPPFLLNVRGTGYDPTNSNPLGRLLSIDVSKHF